MKIAITTIGSRGDLQPYIALGLGLINSGHDVTIVTAKNEEAFVKGFGLGFQPVNVDIQQLMEGEDVQKMARGKNPVSFISSHLQGSKKMKSLLVTAQREIWEACDGADVFIYHPGMPIAFFRARVEKKTSILVNPFPALATPDYPSIIFYALPKLGKGWNMMTHQVFYRAFWSMTKSAISAFWKAEIRLPANFRTSPVKQQLESKQPVINAYSAHLFKHSEHWGDHVHTTGSLVVPGDESFKPDSELEHFISSGDRPVYIGFGSMKDIDAFSRTIEIIEETARLTKERFVVGLGWTKNTFDRPLSDHIFLVQHIPHTWLFPRMKLVIHHGGAGTTATGLLAGKPTIIIPHNADQPAWGKRIHELGLGSKPVSKKKLSAKKLSVAIHAALEPAVLENARVMGLKMQSENGLDNAVRIINDFLHE